MYYGICGGVELHGAEGTKTDLPMIYDKGSRPSTFITRGSVCVVQSDDPPEDEDLRAAFKVTEDTIKAKRSKPTSGPPRELAEDTCDHSLVTNGNKHPEDGNAGAVDPRILPAAVLYIYLFSPKSPGLLKVTSLRLISSQP